MTTRRVQPDGVCACCGKVGVVWTDVELVPGLGYVALEAERCSLPPLCDACDYAQRRWDARNSASCPYADPPPKTPPVR